MNMMQIIGGAIELCDLNNSYLSVQMCCITDSAVFLVGK